MSEPRRDSARWRAQSIVEFALVLPLFALILFGFIDFARYEFSYISLSNAAREMARVAVIPGSVNDTIVDSFNNYALNASDWSTNPTPDTVTITVTNNAGVVQATTACKLTSTHGTPAVRGLMHSPSSDPDACQVPVRAGQDGGWVDILVNSHFAFNPLFENRLTGIVDASFLLPITTLSTTARAYIE